MAPLRPLLLAFALLFAVGACAPVDQDVADNPPQDVPAKPPVPDETPPQDDTMKCDAADTAWAIGKLADEPMVTRIRTETNSKGVRVIKPGMAVTMDYREDRVNIDVDADNRILKVRCG